MKNNRSAIDKLTALWALNESGLGGFLHVFNSPFTGILVGGIAILLISLIAYYAENIWRSVLKALLIVLIIKIAVSPHSPPTAYLSVTFQAVAGAFLLHYFSSKTLALILLGILTFLQSALQKLIVLTIVYGENLWEAIDLYGAWLMQQLGVVTQTSATSLLIFLYLLLYGSCGFLAGWFIKNIITLIGQQETKEDFVLRPDSIATKKKKKGPAFRSRILFLWGITIMVIILAFTFFGGPLLGWKKGVYLILRSLLVLLLWYMVIGPLILKLIRKYLIKKESRYKEDINNALDLFPYFRSIISHTWKSTGHLKGYTRFKYFIAHTILYCIHFEIRPE